MPKGIPDKSYTGEFKQMVVETMHAEKLSYYEAGRQFDVTGHSRIATWERIYLEEGPEGLYIERRGRRRDASGTVTPKLDNKVEEDLIGEVQRLRAEVAYLKKLNALVLQRERQTKRRK